VQHTIFTLYHLISYIGSGINGNCWENIGAPLVTQKQRSNHIMLAGMVIYDEADECNSGGLHVIYTKLDGSQDWIASEAFALNP